jgi:hypothetical protein
MFVFSRTHGAWISLYLVLFIRFQGKLRFCKWNLIVFIPTTVVEQIRRTVSALTRVICATRLSTLELRVATPHRRFVAMELSLRSLDSY